MNTQTREIVLHIARVAALGAALAACGANAAELAGFALLPANTFAIGPTSGQFATGAGGNPLPLLDKQPVQGFSAVLPGPTVDSFYIMQDNGFGAKTNSADTLLRVFAMRPDFKMWTGKKVKGSGNVFPVNYRNGKSLPSFDGRSLITLTDPDRKLGFDIVADATHYPNGANDIPVDPAIKAGRLLTGADFDIEAFRKDKNGNLWFGEEFGPFLVKTDAKGKVLRREIPTPNIVPPGSTATGAFVQSPQNPFLVPGTENLGRSSGFEGMAINPAGDKLYTLLEGTVTGDPAKSLRINEFDIENESYTANNWLYQLETNGTNIGDMTAVNDHQFLVIERNGSTATTPATQAAPFKKIYLIDFAGVANGGFVSKTELVDLMNIADPHDLNGDGSTLFTFPFVTIEDVLILNPRTLLVLNDNNYPGTGGRDTNSDNNEFLKIRLDQPLDVSRCRYDRSDD